MADQDPWWDRQAVVDVCTTYALALDSRDWPLLRTCFTSDAVAEYEGLGEQRGMDAIEATCRSALEPLDASQHLLGNHLVAIDGDSAKSVCYLQAQHVKDGEPGGSLYTVAGRYDDELIRTAEGWRITRRRLTVSWVDGNPDVLAGSGS